LARHAKNWRKVRSAFWMLLADAWAVYDNSGVEPRLLRSSAMNAARSYMRP
jgi:predicted ABC-type ATPase